MNDKKKYDQWLEIILSGGASTFFDSFPNDEDLAEKLNGLFNGDDNIIAEQIKKDRERFHQRPIKGDVLDEQEASPTKFVIRNKAMQLNTEEALAEIVDNIFDNFERNDRQKLDIKIVFYPPINGTPGEVVIEENSGGIEKKRIVPLIQLGFSDRTAGGIGAWGEGFKMAVFALGDEVEVYSHFPKEEPVAIHFPKGWLDPSHSFWKKWKVNTHGIQKNPPDEGSTIIRINYLRPSVMNELGMMASDGFKKQEEAAEKLAEYFGEVYAEKYNDLLSKGFERINLDVTIGSSTKVVEFIKPVRERLKRNLAFIPWLRPIHWQITLNTQVEDLAEEARYRGAKLTIEIYAGIQSEFGYSRMHNNIQSPGVEMWGNGRKFSLKGPISDASVGWEYKFGGGGGSNPASNASSRRLLIVALFKSDDSRDIPWAAPVKNDYNRRSVFYAELEDIFAKVIRLYKNGLRLLDSRIAPFSHRWITLNESEKLKVLFEDLEESEDSIQQFARSRFGRKVLTYKPDFSFHEKVGNEEELTVSRVHGIPTTLINDIVRAAQDTKSSTHGTVELLQAIFPQLYEQAVLEELMELDPLEELEL